jgi:hypothetical protein
MLPVVLAVSHCGPSGKIEQAQAQMDRGNFDGALEILQREYANDPDNPDLVAGLGLVLSVRKGARIASIGLLNRSLKQRRNRSIYRELFLLYIDSGMIDDAKKMISPEYLTVDDFFRSEISVMRKAMACFEKPDRNRVREITDEERSGLRDYLAVRCMLAPGYVNLNRGDLYAVLNGMEDDAKKCESLILLPEKYVVDPFDHDLSVKECRKKYPGSLLMNREQFIAAGVVDTRKLFDDSIFIPTIPDFSEKNRIETEFQSPITTGLPEVELKQ